MLILTGEGDNYLFPSSTANTYFKSEDELTRWLIQNLHVFESYFPSLRLVKQEKFLPYGRADLWCQTSQGTIIAIENQIGNADADHICRLVAYVIGGNAHTGVLICADLVRPQSYLIKALKQSQLELWVFKLDMLNKNLKILSSPNSHQTKPQTFNSQAYAVFQSLSKQELCYEITFKEQVNYIDILLESLLLVRVQNEANTCKLITSFQPSPSTHLAIANECFGVSNIHQLESSHPDISVISVINITLNQALSYLKLLSKSVNYL